VRGAVRYPMIVVAAIAIAIVVITMFVIPNFAPIFRALGDNLPWPTRIILGVSTFFQHYWYVVAASSPAPSPGSCTTPDRGGRYRWHHRSCGWPVIGSLTHQAILPHRALAVDLHGPGHCR